MLESLNQFFERVIGRPESAENREMTLELAVAALLCEIVRADGNVDEREQRSLRELLRQRFRLDDSALDELVELARREVDESVDYYQFVRLINDQYDYDHKVALVGRLWRVAYADGELDPHEEARVRKLAELLYVDHADFIMQKLEVQKEMGIS
ncbi:tellurite resistance TerB family protein [Kushneria aurantia]|uniref:TerB family tellurite resistance protein n=1 Tax=Kushneria aurantia TaxID=504092 RepID=A0ABV6G272_9GAMM|nr:TerB family tellurite resistance protein [Kushneria aurantia]